MSKNNGGPAFPVADPFAFSPANEGDAKRLAEGMTLRDYFAAKAIQGWLAADVECGPETAPILAEGAYKMADAMLAERAK